MHSIKGNIRVYCRVKPTPTNMKPLIEYPELNLPSLNQNKTEIEISNIEIKNPKSSEAINFNFDRVFTGLSNQEDIFNEVKPFIQSALDGENVCIFAYGSTGSGKTFTMQGDYNSNIPNIPNISNNAYNNYNKSIINTNSGILPRCAEFIFDQTVNTVLNQDIKIYFSATEIYNENLYDLLLSNTNNRNNAPSKPLNIYLNGDNIQIKNLTWNKIESKDDILKYTNKASDSRRTNSTKFNSSSSRSHAVFQIKLVKSNNTNNSNNNTSDNNELDELFEEVSKSSKDISTISSGASWTSEDFRILESFITSSYCWACFL